MQVGKIGSIDAYFAEPTSTPKAGIMLIQDIHGWGKKNIRLVADKYAEEGVVSAMHCALMPRSLQHHLCLLTSVSTALPWHLTETMCSAKQLQKCHDL